LVHNNKTPVKHEATKPVVGFQKKNDVETKIEAGEIKKHRKPLIIEKVTRPTSKAVPVLLFLCLLFLGAFAWMVYKDVYRRPAVNTVAAAPLMQKNRNEQEQRLLDSINDPMRKEIFVLNASGVVPLVITDSIIIKQDSLHLIGNGATLVRDSAYKGPALTLSSNTSYVLLDSITLENFDVGLLVKNRGLYLKNVQFKNCRVPVQYEMQLPNNTVVNGRLADTLFYNTQLNNY
jgi:hypothetical protein